MLTARVPRLICKIDRNDIGDTHAEHHVRMILFLVE